MTARTRALVSATLIQPLQDRGGVVLAAPLIACEREIQCLRPDPAGSAEGARQRGGELLQPGPSPNPQRDEVNRFHRSP